LKQIFVLLVTTSNFFSEYAGWASSTCGKHGKCLQEFRRKSWRIREVARHKLTL